VVVFLNNVLTITIYLSVSFSKHIDNV